MRAAAAAIAFALPALALAQGAASVSAARDAGARQQASTQARMNQADAALQEAGPATLPSEADAAALDAAVDAAAATPSNVEESAPAAGPGETYTVQRGDTLWDLSARFLSDPWSWPKIWSNNPQIANPHWIYPGNVLRIGPGGELQQVTSAAPAQAPAAEEDLADIQAPRELADFSAGQLGKAGIATEESDDVRVSGPHRIGYVAPQGVLTRRDSFVTQRELAESAKITAAFGDQALLSIFDRAYADFTPDAPAKAGETYAIYATERQILHPYTHQPFGYATRIMGKARVLSVDGKTASIEITEAYGPMARGMWLTPATGKVVRRLQQRPATKSIDGIIVASQAEPVTEIGEHHVVYVDKGTADGVQDGNVFTVLRNGDPYGKDTTRVAYRVEQRSTLPYEEVGSLIVVEAKENASTALVMQSVRELLVGDRVVAKAPSN